MSHLRREVAALDRAMERGAFGGHPKARRNPSADVESAFRRAVQTGVGVLLVGPAGSGKTALARSAITMLGAPSAAELAEIESVYAAVGGHLPGRMPGGRPFRAPHHTISEKAMIGDYRRDGSARPGEVSLASGGVLFLDELPEFRQQVLDALEHAIQRGEAHGLPAKPAVVIGAADPCPCGGSPKSRGYSKAVARQYQRDLGWTPSCTCSPDVRHRYQTRMEKMTAALGLAILVVA